ncbi:hypothetical protein [Xenorhabdus doucetiae]|uniref:Transposase n=2 Tax=Xenorhabdus doucetiae TaxID=351671 RepID=A0ABY3NU95_9GAMM|nr:MULTISPECIES: hypothetical protein [Xenorhabdus]MBD2785604.1 hypothetical protein [Xenorhabdus sp. 3]MBD2786989.1 hypothetical protein [Xenorhabdus sp. DI]TYP10758.1 hypothetical protein LY16_01142 [Xenorhabdus doucetiae]
MKLKPTKRHYSVEFKLEAVQQVVLHHQRLISPVHWPLMPVPKIIQSMSR